MSLERRDRFVWLLVPLRLEKHLLVQGLKDALEVWPDANWGLLVVVAAVSMLDRRSELPNENS
jgi:hypothetical protein